MCWDCYNHDKGDPYKNFRRGGVDISDFDDEIKHKSKSRKKNKAKSPKPGCEGNDGGSHIYIWTYECNQPSAFSDFYGFEKYEFKVCVGCKKFAPNRYKSPNNRRTERYNKIAEKKYRKIYGDEFTVTKGINSPRSLSFKNSKPSMRHFSWEKHDEDFMAFRDESRRKRPFDFEYFDYLYGW